MHLHDLTSLLFPIEPASPSLLRQAKTPPVMAPLFAFIFKPTANFFTLAIAIAFGLSFTRLLQYHDIYEWTVSVYIIDL